MTRLACVSTRHICYSLVLQYSMTRFASVSTRHICYSLVLQYSMTRFASVSTRHICFSLVLQYSMTRGGMHNEGVPLRSDIMPFWSRRNAIECENFGNSCRYVETNLHLRCAYLPRFASISTRHICYSLVLQYSKTRLACVSTRHDC